MMPRENIAYWWHVTIHGNIARAEEELLGEYGTVRLARHDRLSRGMFIYREEKSTLRFFIF